MTSTIADLDPDVLKGTWVIDPAHTTLAFSARHAMVATVTGHFSDFAGSIELDPGDPAATRAEVTIKADSLESRSPDRDGHLKSDDFLAVEKYPELTFRSTRAAAGDSEGSYRLWGELTVRDVSREVELDVQFQGLVTDPWGKLRAGFEAETVISRKDWGLVWNVALEKGGVLVSDKVKLSLDIAAVKQA
jgi:polyisoprenoid-binding protein YceI